MDCFDHRRELGRIESFRWRSGLNSITVTATDANGSVSRTVSVTRTCCQPGPLALTINASSAHHYLGDRSR